MIIWYIGCMVAEKPKNKEYLIKAYNSQDESRACLAFRYDNSFFMAVNDILNSRDRESCLSFPVEPDFFLLYKWKTIGGLGKSGLSFKDLEQNKFMFVEKYQKKIEDKDKVQSARIYIVEDSFHFDALSYENISYNTEDFDINFINKIKNYHVERLLAVV